MTVSYKEQMRCHKIDEFCIALPQRLKDYYSNLDFQYYIIKFLRNREFAILPAKMDNIDEVKIRNIKCHNVQSFQFWLKNWRLFEDNRIVNFYYSLAEFNYGVPPLYEKGVLIKDACERWNDYGVKTHLFGYCIFS